MHLTRRYFLKSSGALAAYLGVAPLDLFAAAGRAGVTARPVNARKTMVVGCFRRASMRLARTSAASGLPSPIASQE